MRTVSGRAFAKLNLTLEVGDRRQDGYHPLVSVMTHISLSDEITLTREGEDVCFESNASYLRCNDTNLCIRAAKKYFETSGVSPTGVKIKLKKIIPLKSGMGGGSADAALVIELMEQLFGKLSEEKRQSLALSLGADVPFCLTKTPALCEGIGEIITPVSLSSKRVWVVVAKNAQKPSTAQIYSEFDNSPVKFRGSHMDVIRALETGELSLYKKGMHNVFEDNVFASVPKAKMLSEQIAHLGAFAVQMTGAGPTVFGLFEKKEDAVSAVKALRDRSTLAYFAYLV